MINVVIVDYGMGNVKSVLRGLEKIGVSACLSSDPAVIVAASHLILPGVGAFEDGMRGLNDAGIDQAIYEFVSSGNPMLGICLGMQMLLDESKEHGLHKGLGLIAGTIEPIPQKDSGKFIRKTPHIGWNKLLLPSWQKSWSNSCLGSIGNEEFFYFVHSYMAMPIDSSHVLAVCDYEGLIVTSAIKKNNITGLQFHPEKSGESGLRILKDFIS